MKKSEMLEEITEHFNAHVYLARDPEQSAQYLLRKLELMGMLPPTQSPSLVPDTLNGGTKHGPAQRVWDKE